MKENIWQRQRSLDSTFLKMLATMTVTAALKISLMWRAYNGRSRRQTAAQGARQWRWGCVADTGGYSN